MSQHMFWCLKKTTLSPCITFFKRRNSLKMNFVVPSQQIVKPKFIFVFKVFIFFSQPENNKNMRFCWSMKFLFLFLSVRMSTMKMMMMMMMMIMTMKWRQLWTFQGGTLLPFRHLMNFISSIYYYGDDGVVEQVVDDDDEVVVVGQLSTFEGGTL